MIDLTEKRRLLDTIAGIARDAGRAILEVYGTEFTVTLKDDRSPLTEADKRAHTIIDAGLRALDPTVPVLSEEAAPGAEQRTAQLVAVLARRPARRHEGVPEAQRRVHREHRARGRAPGRARCRARTGARSPVLRRAWARRLATGRRRTAGADLCRANGEDAAARGRKPQPRNRRARRLSCARWGHIRSRRWAAR